MFQPNTSIDRHAQCDALDGLLGVLQPILVGVEFLVLAALAREQNQTCLVGLQTGDIEREGLFAKVRAARVDGNADGGSQLAWDACFLRCALARISILYKIYVFSPSTPTA